MGKIIRHATLENIPFWIFAGISAGIGIASLCIPPEGVIDKSVLSFIAWMFAFDSLWVFMCAFKEGLDARFQKGDLSMTFGSKDKGSEPVIEETEEE